MELKINNIVFKYFNNFSLLLKFDSVASAFSCSFYFNPDNDQHKELLKPGQYADCSISHNDELLISGKILSQNFKSGSRRMLVEIGGYSYPGVLENCQIPVSLYPLQSDNLTLKEITDKLLKPFGLSYEVDSVVSSEMDKKIPKTTAKESQTIKAYLSELAAQRNIVITHTPEGALYFTRTNTNQSRVLDIDSVNGTIPVPEMGFTFNGANMHSEITVMKQASSEGGNAGESTIENPYVGAYRPKVMIQNSGDDNDTEAAGKTALASELKNIKLIVKTDRWVVNGSILKPNNLISVRKPELYLYNKTDFFIESVQYIGNSKGLTATLTCVLPEVYNGETPKSIFT